MPVTVSGLTEGMAAVRTFEQFFLPVGLLVIYHVAELRCLNMAAKTSEKLICAACSLIDYVVLFKAHVSWIGAIAISDALLDLFRGYFFRLSIVF